MRFFSGCVFFMRLVLAALNAGSEMPIRPAIYSCVRVSSTYATPTTSPRDLYSHHLFFSFMQSSLYLAPRIAKDRDRVRTSTLVHSSQCTDCPVRAPRSGGTVVFWKAPVPYHQ
jgi:hypothetical protein